MIAEVCSQWSHAYAASPLFGVDCCWCCPVSVSSCLAGDTQPRLSCCQRTGVFLCHTVTLSHCHSDTRNTATVDVPVTHQLVLRMTVVLFPYC